MVPAPGKPPARPPVPRLISHGEACASGPRPAKKNEKEGLCYSEKLSSSQRSQGVSGEGRADARKITSGHSLTYSWPRVPCAKARM